MGAAGGRCRGESAVAVTRTQVLSRNAFMTELLAYLDFKWQVLPNRKLWWRESLQLQMAGCRAKWQLRQAPNQVALMLLCRKLLLRHILRMYSMNMITCIALLF